MYSLSEVRKGMQLLCPFKLPGVHIYAFVCPAADGFGRTRGTVRRGKDSGPRQRQASAQGGVSNLEASRSFRLEGCPGRKGSQHEKGGGTQGQRKGQFFVVVVVVLPL